MHWYQWTLFVLLIENSLETGAVLCKEDLRTTCGCAGDNVTLEFKPIIDESQVIQYYIWYKTDLPGDTSFAKFIPTNQKMEIYVDDVKGRLIPNYNHASQIINLILENVRESDSSEYNLVVRYQNFTQNEQEYKMRLYVSDVCFETPKQDDGCAVSTCFTGDNGMLKRIGDSDCMNETVNGYKMVRICKTVQNLKTSNSLGLDNSFQSTIWGNYSCCNAKGICREQLFSATTFPNGVIQNKAPPFIKDHYLITFPSLLVLLLK